MNILHFVIDEKFISFVQSTFDEVWPQRNRYVIVGAGNKTALRYLKFGPDFKFGNRQYFFMGEMKKDLAWCDIVIVHYLTKRSAYAALSAPTDTPVIWSGWGADYYELFSDRMEMFLPSTLAAINQNQHQAPKMVGRKFKMKEYANAFVERIAIRYDTEDFISRVNYFSAPIEDDYQLVKANFPNFRASYLQLNYGSVENSFSPGPIEVIGQNILLGNSAFPSNNHLEVLELLASLDLSDRTVIVPLSYGENWYKNKIVSEGKRLLGKRFRPLTEFMELEKYNATIAECSYVIMNHKRQQALGNIGAMLYKGAKVFLREENTIHTFFSRNGGVIGNVKSLYMRGIKEFFRLSEDEIAVNRKILENYWSREKVLNNIRLLANLN